MIPADQKTKGFFDFLTHYVLRATCVLQCSTSRCIRHATSMQKRDVRCIYDNGTDADFALCDRGNRPKVKKECINSKFFVASGGCASLAALKVLLDQCWQL